MKTIKSGEVSQKVKSSPDFYSLHIKSFRNKYHQCNEWNHSQCVAAAVASCKSKADEATTV